MIVPALSNEVKGILTRAGVENPAGDAALILEAVTGWSRAQAVVHHRDELSDAICGRAAELARRRATGEPIQYVLGEWPFMARAYAVGKGVLIPRDDTEVVVRAALDRIKAIPSPAVVDLCSGTGIIAVTLQKERPDAAVSAVEKSTEAFAFLEKNTKNHQVDIRLIHADLCDCVTAFADSSLDLIVSNPPYIRSGEIDGLQREISYEPRMALDGGVDGYCFYEQIIRLWTPKLKKGGYIALELGEGQFSYAAELLRGAGYADIMGCPDIQGITRAVTAKRS